ncbi:MAG TPA: aquaporin [Pirellulaceae bacterium]|nr:aquaporin [Pirellulaceae bacterium]HMO92810.1 aquaporin [Pirellulaceae bacterium]HMP69447.1 aquaporin [Pirellulaceae bacterium]
MRDLNKFVAELVGTFVLVFAGTGAIVVNDTFGSITHVGIALTFGLVVIAMIYSIGEISGAHINPAVTIGFWVAGRLSRRQVFPYILAQTIGAVLASLTLRALFPLHITLGATSPAGAWWQSFVFELLLTTILMFVILRVSSGSKETGVMAGVAIGSTVALGALFAGPVCGASMNPARSIAPAIVSGSTQHLWIYILATLAGAIFAVVIDRAVISPIPADESTKETEE